MKKFVRNITAFFLPVFLVAGLFYFVIKSTGELDPIEKNAEKQRENPACMIGLGYNEQTPYYKLLNANYYRAPIISLGTSRVMQFKGVCFYGGFYNCGGAVVSNYDEYRNFLENLTYSPRCVIIGLDAWVFNGAWNQTVSALNEGQVVKIDREPAALLGAIARDWLEQKWSFADLSNYPQHIGFNGRVKGEGFMYDGSYYHGAVYRVPSSSADYGFADTLRRISRGVSRFEWGEDIDPDTVAQLDGLLAYCAGRGIHVVGFLPPFAPSICEAMQQSGHYGYLGKIPPVCRRLFEQYGFEFYDYLDVSGLGMTDGCFLDGFHGSEVVYARILEDMAGQGSEIGLYLDRGHTRELLENAYSGFVFEKPERAAGQGEG